MNDPKEVKLIHEALAQPPTSTCFMISAKWIFKWLRYVNGQDTTPPGEVSNGDLVIVTDPKIANDPKATLVLFTVGDWTKMKLKPGLHEGTEYRIVCINAWRKLRKFYGGNPEIPIMNIHNVAHPQGFRDISPITLHLFDYTKTDPDLLARGIIVSKEATSDQLYGFLEKVLEVPPEKKAEIRFGTAEEIIRGGSMLERGSRPIAAEGIHPDLLTSISVRWVPIGNQRMAGEKIVEEEKAGYKNTGSSTQNQGNCNANNSPYALTGISEDEQLALAMTMSMEVAVPDRTEADHMASIVASVGKKEKDSIRPEIRPEELKLRFTERYSRALLASKKPKIKLVRKPLEDICKALSEIDITLPTSLSISKGSPLDFPLGSK